MEKVRTTRLLVSGIYDSFSNTPRHKTDVRDEVDKYKSEGLGTML